MLYQFAGLVIDIRFRYDFGKKLCENYQCDEALTPDFVVEVTDELIREERQYDLYNSSDAYLECIAAYRLICKKAYEYDCMFMHCSAISYKGNAILFTAPSGTGKSTHARLWREHFGEDVVMINDDKPLLRFIDDKIYACGTPWDGKHHISNNIMVPVKAIVVLEQAPENRIEPMEKKQLFYHLLNQTIRPYETELMQQVLSYCETMLESIPAYKLGCTISDEAVTTAYSALKENFDED